MGQAVNESAMIPSSFLGRISTRTSLISTRDFKISVQLLDDGETVCQEFKKTANAQVILDYVCECLNIAEKDYFGLRYQDLSKHRYWMDLNKPISKQVRGPNVGLRFRVRFYPSDVAILKEEITRYMLFVQLQRDLLHGRLYCPQNEAAILGALILQSVIGDYDAEERVPGYVAEYKLLLKQTEKIEEKIAEAHKRFKGLSAPDAEMEFLKKASKLDTYGFDPYTVTDKQKQTMYIGVTHRGVYIYHVSQMIHHINWQELEKVDYVGKELVITPSASYVAPFSSNVDESVDHEDNSATSPLMKNGVIKAGKTKNALKFLCPSAVFAKHLWRHILSQQAFFNENDAKHIKTRFSKPRIPLLTRGSTFHFPTSKVQYEMTTEDCVTRDGPEPKVARYALQRQPMRQHIYNTANKYGTYPRSRHSEKVAEVIPEDAPINEEIDDSMGIDATIANLSKITCNQVINNEQVTTFTIHLIRKEPLPSQSREASRVEEVMIVADDIVLPETQQIPNMQLNGEGMIAETTTKMLDETKQAAADSNLVENKSSNAGVSAAIAKLFFSLLLFLLLLTLFAVALFEHDSRWLHSLPALDSLRHSIYEPLRHHILTLYARLAPR